MTIKEAYEAVLIELNKVQAPTLLLADFNYLFNKAVQKYFNKRYSLYEINQQSTDDLRVLVKTEAFIPQKVTDPNSATSSYEVKLPNNYVHILNCICEFIDNSNPLCNGGCSTVQVGANKLTTNQWSQVITNYYMRPSINRPYYYIQNFNTPSLSYNGRVSGNRYGNVSTPIMQIKCGELDPRFQSLSKVYIDYLQAPIYVELTQADLDNALDTSTILEFPDYVVYEIINELVVSIMENSSDPRVKNFLAINATVPQKQ